MRGTVKFFNRLKGWGFLTVEGGKEQFFHYSNIIMDGYKELHEGDIVNFEVRNNEDGREQALNVTPIVTFGMVADELAKENFRIMRIRDDKGIHGWYVVDREDKPVVDKEMDLLELAAYVGIDVEGLSA